MRTTPPASPAATATATGPATAARRLAYALVWITPLFWSSNYLIARAAPGVVQPHVLALGRWSLAFALMLPFAWRGLTANRMPWRREWRQMLLLGALGMWVCGAFVYIGGHTTSSVNIALIYAATPISIALVSARLLDERLSAAQIVGVLLALAGVLLVIAKGQPGNLLAVRFAVGDGWIVGAAVSWTAYSVLLRRWPSRLGSAERLVAIAGAGVLVLLPFTLLEAWLLPPLPLSAKALALIAAAALLPGVFAYQAYSLMLRELGAARAGLVLYLGPVYAAASAWALLGERPSWYHALGAALILPSIALATRQPR